MTRVDELRPGDMWCTPAGVWDTVASAGPVRPSGLWQVRTEADTPVWWLLPPYAAVVRVPAAEADGRYITVRISPTRVSALVVTAAGAGGQRAAVTLSLAYRAGRGYWTLLHRAPGEVLAQAMVFGRDAATAAVTAVARQHAAVLRVPFRPGVGS